MSQPVTVPETPTSLFCRKVFHGPASRWTEVPVKQLGRLQGGAGFPHAEQGVEHEELEFHKVNALGSSDANGFLTQSENTVSCSTAQRLGAFVFPARSIVFAKVGAALMLSRFRLLRRKACLDNNMMGLVVRGDHSSDFVRYALELFPMGYVVNPGAVPSINERNIGEVSISVPPQDEQKQIASFLDYETAKIDALIEKQQQLIALLGEKRQAVISHAVTKGLNPDAPMRDSGVEWLGEVPSHWVTSSLRHFATFYTGSTPDRSAAAYWNGDIPWVKTGEVKYERILDTEEKISKLGLDSSSCSIAPAGTLLMALYGQGVTRGRVALLGVPAAFNQACVAINPDKRLRSDFLHAFFLFAYPYIRVGNETTQMNMNVDFVRRIPVVTPPLDEQIAIVKEVDETISRFDSLNSSAVSLIELLQERRTALISAAVTGKIDVRGWKRPSAAPKPETETEVA